MLLSSTNYTHAPIESHVDESLHARVFEHFRLAGLGLEDDIELERTSCTGNAVLDLPVHTHTHTHQFN